MKKLFVVALLSSTMIFAVPVPARTVAEVATTVTQSPTAQQALLSAILSVFTTSCDQIKQHYAVAGSVVLTTGVIALCYTNADFRAMIQAWLGLETTTVTKK